MIRTIKQYEQAIAKVYGIKVEEIYSHRPAVITSKSKVMLIHFMKEYAGVDRYDICDYININRSNITTYIRNHDNYIKNDADYAYHYDLVKAKLLIK